MSLQQVNDFLHSWLPFLTCAGIVWRVYSQARKRITEWAGTLLDNHLAHVQASLERAEGTQADIIFALQEQTELLRTISEK